MPARGLPLHNLYNLYMRQHDAAWLARVEAHVRKEKVKEAPSRRGQAAAAACEAWLQERVEASVFARALQDIEDRCLDCVVSKRPLQIPYPPAARFKFRVSQVSKEASVHGI